MYQERGGQASLEANEVANLRNMIMHHGASSAHPETVEKFAQEIKAGLSQELAQLSNVELSRHNFNPEQQVELLAEFGLVESSIRANGVLSPLLVPLDRLPLDGTELYKKLAQFHESKLDNADSSVIYHSVINTYIPLMQAINQELMTAHNKFSPDHFIEWAYFKIQALRMLATICGEFQLFVAPLTKDKDLLSFLQFCRVSVRHQVGHDTTDFSDSVPYAFYQQVTRRLISLDSKKTTKMLPVPSTGFFQTRTAGSALDAKYDYPKNYVNYQRQRP